ncbi:uncharacterized protein BX664DRAFT_318182 [Halteromyces radiatus]|uniref:uncharacterized protein n=1 Tax=Halteromyces radiatus TaxID=101107 RepID=UPI0022204FA3|nr:uncharacterized protein BX664DRAFT_318182 [Halteromyces radiatus]KAI8078843.1 hypothetical protein BX664DRAFT_318182 [Halteromyces radiatus]
MTYKGYEVMLFMFERYKQMLMGVKGFSYKSEMSWEHSKKRLWRYLRLLPPLQDDEKLQIPSGLPVFKYDVHLKKNKEATVDHFFGLLRSHQYSINQNKHWKQCFISSIVNNHDRLTWYNNDLGRSKNNHQE